MKNVNYNLIKLLHNRLDDLWRIEKHYASDAQSGCKSCAALLKEARAMDSQVVDKLTKELEAHAKAGLE